MDGKSIFNATVCIIGIAILLIHVVNILLKKNRRVDENKLLLFVTFTIIHFITYLTFTLIKSNYTSDNFIIGFYTTFYIMNNIELLLVFNYTVSYIELSKLTKNILLIANLAVFAIFVGLDIINIFSHFFFSSVNGTYTRAPLMFLSQGYQMITFVMVFVLTVFNSKTILTEKISFSTYCVLPIIAIILQNIFPGYAIAYLSIVVSIEILFLFINVRKNMLIAEEEKKNKETEIKLMMSQIQPHFIYNTLSSISTLIKIDPNKAQKGLDDFTDYLRNNLARLSVNDLISFEDELNHVKTYLTLEKMRFGDRLNVVFDIKVTDFLIPPLCVQPIVENAVKHGVLQKIEGGTVIIKSYETDEAYVVEIIDDGVGFNLENVKNNDVHIGISNVKYRLSTMCNGSLEIESEIDKGTKSTIKFYK